MQSEQFEKQPTHNSNREKGPSADQPRKYLPPECKNQFYSTLPANKAKETPDVKQSNVQQMTEASEQQSAMESPHAGAPQATELGP